MYRAPLPDGALVLILNTRARLRTSLRAVHPICHSKPALSLNFPN